LTYEDAKNIGLKHSDLVGITEIVPNEEYDIRLSSVLKKRKRKKVFGTLIKTIKEKEKLIRDLDKELEEKPKKEQKVMENITFEEAVIRTIDYLVELGETTDAMDLNTAYDYLYRINSYVYDYFPRDSKVSNINEESVKKFLTSMFRREKKDGSGLISVSSVEKAYSALNWVLRYCSEISNPPLLKENPTKRILFKTLVPKGRSKGNRKNRSHSEEEVKSLIETLDKKANIRLKSMINVIADVGCRDEECSGLKWKNIDEETGLVDYDEAITSKIYKKYSAKHSGTRAKPLKSRYSYRNNYLTPYTLNCLKNLKTFKKALGLPVGPDDYIFTVWGENTILSPISFGDEFGDFRRKYGFSNITPYDLRHYLSNTLLESGMPAKDVAIYLGNTPRTLLQSYTDISNKTQKQMRAIINDRIRSNKHKSFDIDVIAYVLNCDDKVENKRAYELLDFVVNKKVNVDEEDWVIQNAKELILTQHPSLESFYGDDDNIVQAKIDIYKQFNNDSIELTQDPDYYFSRIKI